eukprot:6064300-Pleurochrysis_carterae.AAC.8
MSFGVVLCVDALLRAPRARTRSPVRLAATRRSLACTGGAPAARGNFFVDTATRLCLSFALIS